MPTKIEYVDEVWNPVTGCTKCSVGCQNCYAEIIAKRFWGKRKFSDVHCHPERLEQPLHWRKPRRILVPSMGDLFHESVPYDLEWPPKFLTKVWATMLLCPQHTLLVLTKRIKRAQRIFGQIWSDSRQIPAFQQRISQYLWAKNGYKINPTMNGLNLSQIELLQKFDKGELWPIPNVHLGVTICTQKEADEKIPILLQIPATHRWLSIEPCLGEININLHILKDIKRQGYSYYDSGWKMPFDWVVVGCESGSKRRPCKLEHIRSIVQQCAAAGVGCYVKQIEIDGKVEHDVKKFPKDLRVRDEI